MTIQGTIGSLESSNLSLDGFTSNFSFYTTSSTTSQEKSIIGFETKSGVQYTNSNIDYNIDFEVGTIIKVLFYNAIKGVTKLTFNFNNTSYKARYFNGSSYTSISSFDVVNGLGIVSHSSSEIQFVVINSSQVAAINTYYSEAYTDTNFHYTTVVLNEATVGGAGNSIASHSTFTGIKTPSFTTDSTSTTSGASTTSKGLCLTGGWYPIGVAGWSCEYRYYDLPICYLFNRTSVTYRSGSTEYTGWGASLSWKIHNPTTTASASTISVYILWMR